MSVQPFGQSQRVRSARGSLSKVLIDRQGTSYGLLVSLQGHCYCLKLYDGSISIGEARCSWQDDGSMVLDDIAIANEVKPSLNPWQRLQQWIWQTPIKPVNYRQRGLGTLLLQQVIEQARRLGASSLRGEVFQADVENNPGLLNWYKRNGFHLAAPQPEQSDVLANIVLELRSGKSNLPQRSVQSGLATDRPKDGNSDPSQLSSSSH